MIPNLYFLSGLPRSGSTVLAALLNQRPDIVVSSTSGLIDIMGAVCQTWEQNPTTQAQGKKKEDLFGLLRSLIPTMPDGKVIVDKSRGWVAPPIMQTMTNVLGTPPKIVATVRDVPSCAASFVKVAKPENLKNFLYNSALIEHLKGSYVSLKLGLDAAPENILIVDYDDFMADSQAIIDRIEKFWGLKPFKHDFDNIDGSTVWEDDSVWGIPNLHKINPKIGQRSTDSDNNLAALGPYVDMFRQPAFWKGEVTAFTETPLIDLQLEAGIRGDFVKGWEIAQTLEQIKPEDDRAAFNRGWYLLRQGKLSEGMKLMDRGRTENVFGNPPQSSTPAWDGKTRGTVLLQLEGGLGDQIQQVRYAKNISKRGCKTVVSCSPELAPLFKNVAGVSAVCQHRAAGGVYHDFHVQGMSAVVPLGYEYENLDGRPYINSPQHTTDRFRIGLRWQGNPRFEEEQHRLFPSLLMFDAVKGFDVDFVSLQRDEGSEVCPDWAIKVPLDTWEQTAQAVADCDLVISSCTSVAHLSAAMGIPTWIITPVMPYFLWALPGDKTPWYDSVKLFRQKTFGDWSTPFQNIRTSLTEIMEMNNVSLRAS